MPLLLRRTPLLQHKGFALLAFTSEADVHAAAAALLAAGSAPPTQQPGLDALRGLAAAAVGPALRVPPQWGPELTRAWGAVLAVHV
jgi:hypothetical protein